MHKYNTSLKVLRQAHVHGHRFVQLLFKTLILNYKYISIQTVQTMARIINTFYVKTPKIR
jgi:hypothetical protein